MRVISDGDHPLRQATLYLANELKFAIKPGDFISTNGSNVDPCWLFYYGSDGKIYPLQVTEYPNAYENIDQFIDESWNYEGYSINCLVSETFDRNMKTLIMKVLSMSINKDTKMQIIEHNRDSNNKSIQTIIKEDTLEECLLYYFENKLSERKGNVRGHFFDITTAADEVILPIYHNNFDVGDYIEVTRIGRPNISITAAILSIQREFKDGLQKLTYNLDIKDQLVIYNDLYYKTSSIRTTKGIFDVIDVCKIEPEGV